MLQFHLGRDDAEEEKVGLIGLMEAVVVVVVLLVLALFIEQEEVDDRIAWASSVKVLFC